MSQAPTPKQQERLMQVLLAPVVSEKIVSGSCPETKVSEQRTLATKPVATFGTSCARTAVSARAPHSVAVTTRMIRFLGVTVFSGNFRLHWRAGHDPTGGAAARRIRKSR